MAASSMPSFSPQFLVAQPQFYPIPYLNRQASISEQLSIIEMKIQEIIVHLEFPTPDDKALSFLARLQQTRDLKSELISLRLHLSNMIEQQPQAAPLESAFSASPFGLVSAKDMHHATRLMKIINSSNHLAVFLSPYIIDATIEKTRAIFGHFQTLLAKLSIPQVQPNGAASAADEISITSTIIDEVRLSLQEMNAEITEINRGNIFSSTWQGPMIHYYHEAERTARVGMAVIEKMNQKFDEYLRGASILTTSARYVENKIKETDQLLHQIYSKIGVAHPRLHLSSPPFAPDAVAAKAPEEVGASSTEDQTKAARMPKRKASERFYENLKAEAKPKKSKPYERKKTEKKRGP